MLVNPHTVYSSSCLTTAMSSSSTCLKWSLDHHLRTWGYLAQSRKLVTIAEVMSNTNAHTRRRRRNLHHRHLLMSPTTKAMPQNLVAGSLLPGTRDLHSARRRTRSSTRGLEVTRSQTRSRESNNRETRSNIFRSWKPPNDLLQCAVSLAPYLQDANAS